MALRVPGLGKLLLLVLLGRIDMAVTGDKVLAAVMAASYNNFPSARNTST